MTLKLSVYSLADFPSGVCISLPVSLWGRFIPDSFNGALSQAGALCFRLLSLGLLSLGLCNSSSSVGANCGAFSR